MSSLTALKKILILTAGFGEGEDVAAWNLHDAIEHLAPSEAKLEVLDLLDSCYGRFHELLQHTFQAAMKQTPRLWHRFYQLLGTSRLVEGQIDGLSRLRRTLRDALLARQPDVVVSTCPVYCGLIEEIFRDGRSRDFTLITLVTEAVIDDSPWSKTPGDYFAVANETAAGVLAAAGIPEDRIRVFGFPVQMRFARLEKKIELPDLADRKTRPRLLYLINSARKKAPKLLDRLLEHPDWDITAWVGRETELDEMARAKAATASDRLEVIGHTRRMPQLLLGHHLVISRAGTGIVQEAIAARCPMIVFRGGSDQEAGNLSLLRQANAGAQAEKPREVIDWIERALRDEGRLLSLWRKNLESLGRPDSALNLGRFVLSQAAEGREPVPHLRALPAPTPEPPVVAPLAKGRSNARLHRLPKKLLMCDLHTHTTWSDGKLSVPEIVDFYGQRGFDALCITDHLCDPKRLLGKLVNLTGLVIPPGELAAYFEEIEREKKRALAKYDLLLMTGIEFNKDGYTPKTSTHLLGVDLRQPIDPTLDLKVLIVEIQAQGGLAIASHPHEIKSEWGKNTLYLWEHVDEYAPLLDAWEVANRDDIFNPIGLKKLPFIASSDFHKPKHIHSWKTVLYCEKESEAIKHCIRVNRDVSLTLYRDHRFGLDQSHLQLPALETKSEVVEFRKAELAARHG